MLAAAYLGPRLPFRRGPFPDGPVRMRLALEQLGGAWVKLGQMLALRFDLLPAAYCDELFKLLNEVRPFPYPQVREIVRQELGADPEPARVSHLTSMHESWCPATDHALIAAAAEAGA